MKTPNGIENPDQSWEDQYLDRSQIDRRLVNQLRNEYFELNQANFDHRSAVVRSNISGVLEQYFATAMRKQKNHRNIPIYRKWASPLADIRCSLEKADILSLPTLAYNEGTISGTIDIIRELTERLELIDEVVRDKSIFIKGDLMTVRISSFPALRTTIHLLFRLTKGQADLLENHNTPPYVYFYSDWQHGISFPSYYASSESRRVILIFLCVLVLH